MICRVRHAYRNIARDRNYNYNLFTNFPWPGNSEGTFRSLSHAATCPPVYPTRRGFTLRYIFIMFGLTRPGIELESIALVADALSTRLLIGLNRSSVDT